MKLSLAITTFNRFDMTIASFEKVIDDPRIDEIMIVDDVSTDGSAEKLWKKFYGHPKVEVKWNRKNRGMSLNKFKAISVCRNDFVIIFDSDNIIDTDYIDAIDACTLFDDTIYMPSFAKPSFDYRAFEDLIINKGNIKEYLDQPMFEQCLNTCNMVVPRRTYQKTYHFDRSIKETDTLWMNYLWLKSGREFYIVPGMTYEHKVHSGSGWLANAAYNIEQGERIKNLIREL